MPLIINACYPSAFSRPFSYVISYKEIGQVTIYEIGILKKSIETVQVCPCVLFFLCSQLPPNPAPKSSVYLTA